jgi:hypothetical protein
MRRPVGLSLARSMMAALACMAVWPVAAHATTCGERIATLEMKLQQAEADRRVLSARESTAATMHRQPTPESIARAETRVEAHLASRLKVARRLNAQGKEAKCFAALGRFAADD